MDTRIPVVERTDHADTLGIRRPDCEPDTADAIHDARVRAEEPVDPVMPTVGERDEIIVADEWRKTIRVVSPLHRPPGTPGPELVAPRNLRRRTAPFEDAGITEWRHGLRSLHQVDAFSLRQPRADDDHVIDEFVPTEQSEGIVQPPLQQATNLDRQETVVRHRAQIAHTAAPCRHRFCRFVLVHGVFLWSCQWWILRTVTLMVYPVFRWHRSPMAPGLTHAEKPFQPR